MGFRRQACGTLSTVICSGCCWAGCCWWEGTGIERLSIPSVIILYPIQVIFLSSLSPSLFVFAIYFQVESFLEVLREADQTLADNLEKRFPSLKVHS